MPKPKNPNIQLISWLIGIALSCITLILSYTEFVRSYAILETKVENGITAREKLNNELEKIKTRINTGNLMLVKNDKALSLILAELTYIKKDVNRLMPKNLTRK